MYVTRLEEQSFCHVLRKNLKFKLLYFQNKECYRAENKQADGNLDFLICDEEKTPKIVFSYEFQFFMTSCENQQYATDFGAISKESLKRITKWGTKYFTHPSSYYPVPQTGMSFKDVRFMTPLPTIELSKRKEETMKDWLENNCPVGQITLRSERDY